MGAPAAVLRQRALLFARNATTPAHTLTSADSAQAITLQFFVPGSWVSRHYQPPIREASGGYDYSLSDFAYTIRGGEGSIKEL